MWPHMDQQWVPSAPAEPFPKPHGRGHCSSCHLQRGISEKSLQGASHWLTHSAALASHFVLTKADLG